MRSRQLLTAHKFTVFVPFETDTYLARRACEREPLYAIENNQLPTMRANSRVSTNRLLAATARNKVSVKWRRLSSVTASTVDVENI